VSESAGFAGQCFLQGTALQEKVAEGKRRNA
jgi:hypothetical protein